MIGSRIEDDAELVLRAPQFEQLAIGYGDEQTFDLLGAGQRTRRTALLIAAGRRSADALRALERLTAVQRLDPGAVRTVLEHPFLEVWAERNFTGRKQIDDPAYLHQLTDAAEQLAAGGGLASPGSAVRAISEAGTWQVRVDDVDPYRDCFNLAPTTRLSPGQMARAVATTEAAWALISKRLPQHANGVRRVIAVLVPLVAPVRGGASASARRAFGAVGLHLPSDPRELALLLVHEHMHVKLGALLDLVDLVRPGGQALYRAPWRLDPRPVGALLQGAYAHLGVVDFWRSAAATEQGTEANRAGVEFERWQQHTATAIEILSRCGELTPAGTRFVNGMARAVDTEHR